MKAKVRTVPVRCRWILGDPLFRVATCLSPGLPWHYARCLLQLAATHLQACPFDPTSALPPLLRYYHHD